MDTVAAALRAIGGMIVGVQRPGVDFRGGSTSTNHMSQRASAVVLNNSTVSDRERRVEIVAQSLGALQYA